MKAISKATLLVLVGGLLAFGTGCAQEGLPAGQSPEDVIREALLNQQEITKSIFEVEIKADLEGEVDGDQNALDGVMTLKGTNDMDLGSMQLDLFVDGKMKEAIDGEVTENSLKVAFEIRTNNDGTFINLANVNISDEEIQDMVNTFVDDYIGEWVKLSFVQQEDLTEAGYMDFDYDESDPLPFKNIEYVGNKDILGVNSYHFTAEIDEEEFISMFEASDAADVDDFLDAVEMKGDVYVGIDEMMITGFGGTATLSDPEMNGTLEFSFKMNPTKANPVVTPQYEEELTEEDLMTLMFGGAMMDPSMQMQPADVDPDAFEMSGDSPDQIEIDEETLKQLEEMEGMDYDFDM